MTFSFDKLTQDEIKEASGGNVEPQSTNPKDIMNYVPAQHQAPVAPTMMMPGAIIPSSTLLKPLGQMAQGATEGISQVPWGVSNLGHKYLGTPRSKLLDRFHQWAAPPSNAPLPERVGYFAGQQLPYMAMPLGGIAKGFEAANALSHTAPLLSKLAVSAAKAVPEAAAGYLGSASMSPKMTTAQDLENAALFGITGHLGRVGQTAVSRIGQGVKDIRARGEMPNSAIIDEKTSIHPDLGNISGEPSLASKFSQLEQTPFSGARELGDKYSQKRIVRQQNVIDKANSGSRKLLNELSGGTHPQDLPVDISEGIKKSYWDKHLPDSNDMYEKATAGLKGISSKGGDFKKTRAQIDGLIPSGKTSTFPRLKQDVPDNLSDLVHKIKEVIDKKSAVNLGDALASQRDLSDITHGLQSSQRFEEARPYNNIYKALKGDIADIAKSKKPDSYQKLQDANSHFTNTIMPYRNNNLTNDIITNPLNVPHAPENISQNIVKGGANERAILNSLPAETKNKIGADLLSSHEIKSGDIHPDHSLLMSKSIGANNPRRMRGVISPKHQRQLADLRKKVHENKKVLIERMKKANSSTGHQPTLYLSPTGHVSTHVNPLYLGHSPMGRFYTELLTHPRNAEALKSGRKLESPRLPWWGNPATQNIGVRGIGSYAITPSNYSKRR
ncbi:MAG: hypothetical protein JKY48_03375 [Flavobacteriales bacterium]|nr:hypothetical protein [Flavobacteriales bacterium]